MISGVGNKTSMEFSTFPFNKPVRSLLHEPWMFEVCSHIGAVG